MIKTHFTIYGLTNRRGRVCYVGRTSNLRQRMYMHRSLHRTFCLSGVIVLARARKLIRANQAERKWIKFFGRENLANKRDGDKDFPGYGKHVHPWRIQNALYLRGLLPAGEVQS